MSAMNYGRWRLLFGMPSASQLVVETGGRDTAATNLFTPTLHQSRGLHTVNFSTVGLPVIQAKSQEASESGTKG